MSASTVAVVATEATEDRAAAVAASLGASADVRVVGPVGSRALDVEITPAYLAESYALYRTLREREWTAVVFPDDLAAGYCTARAKETGGGFDRATLVVDVAGPTMRTLEEGDRPFLSRGRLGLAVAERLALELADGLVCADEEVAAWLLGSGWSLPRRYASPVEAAGSRTTHEVAASGGAQISVVVSHRERPRYLPQCLDGLARQTAPPAEVIVADDGSTSAAAIRMLEEIEGRSWPWPLRVVRLERGGAASARNGGSRAATSDFVVFVDDDDVPFDRLLETLWRARAHSGADIVVAGARWFRGDGPPTAQAGDVVRVSLCNPGELGLLSNQYGGPTNLWPRELLEGLGGFPAAPLEDWNLLARAALAGARLTTTPDPLYWYRQTPESAYTSDTLGVRDAALPPLADAFAEWLPRELRLLPRLAAGAYSELDRRKGAGADGGVIRRGRLLAGRALRAGRRTIGGR